MKRKAFSLFEITVALPLLALLLGFISQYTTLFFKWNQQHDLQMMKAIEKHYFQRRFQQMLMRLDKKKIKIEHIKNDSFQFTFDNGYSPYPLACNSLQATLFCDPVKKQLLVNLYHKKELIRTELLLADVDNLKIQYLFEYPNKKADVVNPFELSSEKKEGLQSKCCALKLTLQNTFKPKKESLEQYFFLLTRSQSPLE